MRSIEDRLDEIREDPVKLRRAFKAVWIIAYGMLMLGAFIIIWILAEQLLF